jgi:signal transduction histidine kinase
MARSEQPNLRCVLLAPSRAEFEDIRRVVKSVARDSDIQLVHIDEIAPAGIAEIIYSEILRADLIIAILSEFSPNVLYEIGLAHATGKPVIFLVEEQVQIPLVIARSAQRLVYGRSEILTRLRPRLRRLFQDFKREPRRFTTFRQDASGAARLPVIDLDRLEPRHFENLCFELLTQMGYKRVEWGKELRDVDVVATLPKKDPDGFEYEELWLISTGSRAPPEMLLEMAARDPEYLLHGLRRSAVMNRFRTNTGLDTPITLLIMLIHDNPSAEFFHQELRRIEKRASERRSPYSLRLRVWDRQQVANLIQQYPQIAHKYFSDEGRSQAEFRKSIEQMYLENASLTEKYQATITALKDEQDKRARAERDAVWKDVAFTAAHKLGNPIFALETNLQGIKRTVLARPQEALEIATEMGSSIEKAKTIIEQFKSLTKAQEISVRAVDLVPLLESASRVVTENGVQVKVAAEKNTPQALADPVRLTECFDELFANALHWLNKPDKLITVKVDTPQSKELPPGLDEAKKYIRVRFEDNGCGIPADKKEQIFSPFYTTYPHGTGLGLSLVQRIVEGQGGLIHEIGSPNESAVFELFLPQATPKR